MERTRYQSIVEIRQVCQIQPVFIFLKYKIEIKALICQNKI